jgi:hypothetical protein
MKLIISKYSVGRSVYVDAHVNEFLCSTFLNCKIHTKTDPVCNLKQYYLYINDKYVFTGVHVQSGVDN